jgi:hypothetical protein
VLVTLDMSTQTSVRLCVSVLADLNQTWNHWRAFRQNYGGCVHLCPSSHVTENQAPDVRRDVERRICATPPAGLEPVNQRCTFTSSPRVGAPPSGEQQKLLSRGMFSCAVLYILDSGSSTRQTRWLLFAYVGDVLPDCTESHENCHASCSATSFPAAQSRDGRMNGRDLEGGCSCQLVAASRKDQTEPRQTSSPD